MSKKIIISFKFSDIRPLVHVVRLIKGWAVQIGPHSISMSVSWVGLVVATLIAIWGFMQLG